jgi:hypothetical protein
MGKRSRRRSIIYFAIVGFLGASITGAIIQDAYTRGVDTVVEKSKPDLIVNKWPSDLTTYSSSLASAQFMLPRKRSDLHGAPTSNDDEAFQKWAAQYGGVRANAMVVSFAVTVGKTTPVQVTSVSARVLTRRPAIKGVFLAPSGAGDLFQRVWSVDLDSNPIVQAADPDSSDDGDWTFPISVGSADTLVLSVIAHAKRYDVDWVVDVHYVAAGQERAYTITDHGKPFRLSGDFAKTGAVIFANDPSGTLVLQ